MSQFAGKYLLADVAAFEKNLKEDGVPADKIENFTQGDHYLELKVDGQKLSINEHHGKIDHRTEVVLGQEVEQVHGPGKVKITAKLDGNVLTLDTKTADGKVHTKSFTFTGNQVESKRPSHKTGNEIKHIFKKA